MSRVFPAIDIEWTSPPDEVELGRLQAALDDHQPTAIEELPSGARIFFTTATHRDAGHAAAQAWSAAATVRAVDVPDEQWAERSQAAVRAIRVRGLTIAPPWDAEPHPATRLIVIQPSMGFGTGHHASTRLCLDLLQEVPLDRASVLDVGTGSGVLAIAAWRLGAARVTGIDVDPDAITSARENLALNEATPAVQVRVADVQGGPADADGPFDVVTANLTGAMLQQFAGRLAEHLHDAGILIASGLLSEEASSVRAALEAAGLRETSQRSEDGWVGLTASRVPRPSPPRP